MLFQEGFDVGTVLYPMLVVVGACLLGLVIWLFVILTRAKKEPDAQPVKQQFTDEPGHVPLYTLAIRRAGTEWEIYVKGLRANADTIYDSTTRKEALEALRVLARYARDRLQVKAEPMGVVPEVAPQISQARSELSSEVTPSTVEFDLRGVSRPTGPYDYPSASTGVPDMNLAQEIGEIVDELLAKTPSLQKHAVDLLSAQTEGINFVVDGAVYNEVEDIPIPEIRELIRKATREWERR